MITNFIAIPAMAVAASWIISTWMPPLFQNFNADTAADPVVVVRSRVPPTCEGYWPDMETCLELGKNPPTSKLTEDNADCPQWRVRANWEGKEEISTKLRTIEGLAKEWEGLLQEITPAQLEDCGGQQGVKPPVWIVRQRGLAWSRIEENVMAGNSEYQTDSGECWTDALLPLYMDEYGVEPSEKFKRFVAEYDVQAFRDALALLRTKMGYK